VSDITDLSIRRHASEIVKTVMMSVVMKEHPETTTDAVAAKLKLILESRNENS
jgi:hydrogenase maturation factor HypE